MTVKQRFLTFRGGVPFAGWPPRVFLCIPVGRGPRAAQAGPSQTLNANTMEFLNRIELNGVVGRAEVNVYNGIQVCNFSVVTEYSTRDREGNPAVETTWFNVSTWEGRDNPNFSLIQKGVWIHVMGRVRLRRYMTQDNEERSSLEVVARRVSLIPREDTQIQPQRDW